MKPHKTGLEIELHLIEEDGSIANKADEILNHPNTPSFVTDECSLSMIEIISDPYSDLVTLMYEFSSSVLETHQIAQTIGLRFLPSTPIGGDDTIQYRKKDRYKAKIGLLGLDNWLLEGHVAGTHVHTDKLERELQGTQYNLMTAADPIFTLMAATPFLRGENTLADHRVYSYRQITYAAFPQIGQLLTYLKTIDEVELRQLNISQELIGMLKERNLPTQPFGEYDSLWGPLRIKEKTIEGRGCDTNLLSRVAALAAFYKGLSTFVGTETPSTIIKNDGPVEFSNGVLLLPDFKYVKHIEALGFSQGIQNPEVLEYDRALVELSLTYLSDTEKKLMDPFVQSLQDGMTLSRGIIDYAKSKGIYQASGLGEDASKQLRLFAADIFEQDLLDFHSRMSDLR